MLSESSKIEATKALDDVDDRTIDRVDSITATTLGTSVQFEGNFDVI